MSRSLTGLYVMAVLTALGPNAATAQGEPPDTLRLADAVRTALASNPMLQAVQAGARAAGERVGPAGAWPEPELQLGLMNRMASDFGATADPMTMDQLQLMQMLPWPGKLGNARRAARHRATAAVADTEEQARMLGADVRMAYYDLAAMDRSLDVMARTLRLLQDLTEVTTAMYSVGSSIQQDVLRADVEVARMTEEIARMGQERVAAAARLNALLGRDATVAVPAVELPEVDRELPTADSLVSLAQANRPALKSGTERVASAEAGLAAVRREIFPDLTVGLAYQRRPAFDDMLSLMLGVTLPLFAGARQLPMRREMAAMRDMAQAELQATRTETVARVVELRARAERDRNLARLYRTRILPQARASVEAAISSYRVGRVPFMTLVDNQMTVNRYEIETYRLVADFHQAVGELEAMTGELP